MRALELRELLEQYSDRELKNMYIKVRINDSYYNGVGITSTSVEVDLDNEELVFEV